MSESIYHKFYEQLVGAHRDYTAIAEWMKVNVIPLSVSKNEIQILDIGRATGAPAGKLKEKDISSQE